ncbi:MAG: arylesterase [Allorhizobium sp.]
MKFKAVILQFAVIATGLLLWSAQGFAADGKLQLVGFGDSLMAGYQLPETDGLPAQLQAALNRRGVDATIANAGVSGDTSAAGLARVDWSVPDGTDGVILELGANDALRGVAPEETEKNLEEIIVRLQGRGMAVLLVGMIAPPNMGPDYAARFNPLYQRLAEKYQLLLYPFILDGVATKADLQLVDGMHPNTKGVAVMAERMLPMVEQFSRTIMDRKK